jgi:hypothetical protein
MVCRCIGGWRWFQGCPCSSRVSMGPLIPNFRILRAGHALRLCLLRKSLDLSSCPKPTLRFIRSWRLASNGMYWRRRDQEPRDLARID